jgi:hypothetical protein
MHNQSETVNIERTLSKSGLLGRIEELGIVGCVVLNVEILVNIGSDKPITHKYLVELNSIKPGYCR